MTVRNPRSKAAITGADLRNPSRYAGSNSPLANVIGDPPERMTEAAKAAWYEFEKELPWLNRSHRAIVKLASVLRAKFDEGADGINHIQVYSAILSKLGATPADASRVFWPSEDDEDPADGFFNRRAGGHA